MDTSLPGVSPNDEMTETKPGETTFTDPVIPPSSEDVKPDPIFEHPDTILIPRNASLQSHSHHMDILPTQVTVKQEPGMLDSPDIVLGYQDWQKSPELHVSEDVPIKKEQLLTSFEDQGITVQSLHLYVPQRGDGIQTELESTKAEDSGGFYMCTTGKLVKSSEDPKKNTLSPSQLTITSPVPVPVTLYGHVTAGTTEVDDDDSGNALEGQTILADSSGTRSRLMLESSNIDNSESRIHKYLLRDYRSVMESHLLHMIRHSDEKPLSCTECDYCTCRKFALITHMRTHIGEKPFKCSLCDYSTSRKFDLTRHMITHTREMPFKCSLNYTECDYCASTKSALTRHMRTHIGEKPFKCSLCDYSTSRKFALTSHMRTHTGEKPFKCSLCDYRTGRKDDLVLHMWTHTDEKPLKCSLCDHRLTRKSDLTIHMRKHSGEKPFKCSLCDYRTARKGDLGKHMRRHSAEKPFK